MLKVKDIMVKDLVTVGSHANIRDAVARMNEHEIGCLIVIENESVIGMLTERDVLKRVVAEARNPQQTIVKDVMSKPLVVVGAETSLEDAVRIMFDRRIKKLPVVKNKKLLGLVTLTDIARLQPLMAEYIRKLAAEYTLPKRMEKVIRYYVV